jgi:hypothetical protein
MSEHIHSPLFIVFLCPLLNVYKMCVLVDQSTRTAYRDGCLSLVSCENVKGHAVKPHSSDRVLHFILKFVFDSRSSN